MQNTLTAYNKEVFNSIKDLIKTHDKDYQSHFICPEFDFNRLIKCPEELVGTKAPTTLEEKFYSCVLDHFYQKQFSTKKYLELLESSKKLYSKDYPYYAALVQNMDKCENDVLQMEADFEAKRKPFDPDINKSITNIIHLFFNFGHTNWLTWRIENWNSKWNACDVFVSDDTNSIEFLTKWEAPVPVFEKLKEKLIQTHPEYSKLEYLFETYFTDDDEECTLTY